MSQDAQTKTATHDDGSFVRTALVIDGHDTGSIVLVDKHGKRVGMINIFYSVDQQEKTLMVDVIDVDDTYTTKRALVFDPAGNGRQVVNVPGSSNLVASHFTTKR